MTARVMDKIICVGKNYFDHAAEMGDPVPSDPVIFLKPPSSLLPIATSESVDVELPQGRGTVHFECEIVLRLDKNLKFSAVTLGLDLTLRDLQSTFKKWGQPWELAKVFKNSAVVGQWLPLNEFPQFLSSEFQFVLDGEVRQRGLGSNMRFKPDELLSYLTGRIPLCPGDLIFTGTPAGVGPLKDGQLGALLWHEQMLGKCRFVSARV